MRRKKINFQVKPLSLSESQMRGNYSSSDYETVGIIENQSERMESGGKEGGGWQFVLNGQRMKRWQVKKSPI